MKFKQYLQKFLEFAEIFQFSLLGVSLVHVGSPFGLTQFFLHGVTPHQLNQGGMINISKILVDPRIKSKSLKSHVHIILAYRNKTQPQNLMQVYI
jgi:hypothetical protein